MEILSVIRITLCLLFQGQICLDLAERDFIHKPTRGLLPLPSDSSNILQGLYGKHLPLTLNVSVCPFSKLLWPSLPQGFRLSDNQLLAICGAHLQRDTSVSARIIFISYRDQYNKFALCIESEEK